jgi:hypothetical protein
MADTIFSMFDFMRGQEVEARMTKPIPRAPILLVAQVLIGGDENLKPMRLGGGEQFAVFPIRPPQFVSCVHLMRL